MTADDQQGLAGSHTLAERRAFTRCFGERATDGQSNKASSAPRAADQKAHKEAAMGLFSKDITSMDDLFVRDIYYAEKQIEKALPDMVEKSNDPQLKQGFQTHLRETQNHVKRLEQVQAGRQGTERRGLPRDRRHHRGGR